jgi:hypothetical protein
MGRREFLFTAGALAAELAGTRRPVIAAEATTRPAGPKGVATVRVAFLYPPSEQLRKEGYFSWPGAGFDAEGHHRQYAEKLEAFGRELGVQLVFEPKALTGKADAERLIAEVKQTRPDGLLLVAFKKSEWEQIKQIIAETGVPTIAVATMGVLLMSHIQQLRHQPGVHVISSLDNFDAMRDGLNMIRTARWMRDATILSISGSERGEYAVPLLGTRVKRVPTQRFIELYHGVSGGSDVDKYVREYQQAKERREPSETDVVEAARAMVACERLIREEGGEALMMSCLEGIAKREIPPPCLAFMSLRDAGFVAGCQNDLDATLTMMLGQQLLGKPGFQHNPACDTEKNLYYGSHCTSPRRLAGPKGPAQPFILRDHAEAGVGAVPQVLWPIGEAVTIAQYISDEQPRLFAYAGKTVELYDMPPAGGCRTNLVATVEGIGACDITPEHMLHPTLFLGDHVAQLQAFCRLYGVQLRA